MILIDSYHDFYSDLMSVVQVRISWVNLLAV